METSQLHGSVSNTDFNLHFKSLKTWFQFYFCYFVVIIAVTEYRSLILQHLPEVQGQFIISLVYAKLLFKNKSLHHYIPRVIYQWTVVNVIVAE